MTPRQAATTLADLPISETLATTLASQAASLAEQIRASLATPPGGPHAQPWRQTGSLQSSIANTADGLAAAVGSNSPAATPQELGTATIPPRPFLAPAASAAAQPLARAVGQAVADLLARQLT